MRKPASHSTKRHEQKTLLLEHFARIRLGKTMKYVKSSVSSLSIDQFQVFDIVIKCNIALSYQRY